MNKRQKIDGFRPKCNTPVSVLSLKAVAWDRIHRCNHVFHFDDGGIPPLNARLPTGYSGSVRYGPSMSTSSSAWARSRANRSDDQEKTALAENIIGSGDDWLTELSTGQLREVLMLRSDAMEIEV